MDRNSDGVPEPAASVPEPITPTATEGIGADVAAPPPSETVAATAPTGDTDRGKRALGVVEQVAAVIVSTEPVIRVGRCELRGELNIADY